MKVLLVVTNTFGIGGITSVILDYYKYLDCKKITCDLLVQNEQTEEIRRIVSDKGGKLFVLKGRKKNILRYYKDFKGLVRKNRYDIVHVHGSSALISLELMAAKKAGCKIRIAHSHSSSCQHRIIDRVLRPVFYGLYTYALACGKEAGRWLFGEREYEVVRNGCDLGKYKFDGEARAGLRKEYNLDGKIVIGQVGRFNEMKNHKYSIEVLRRLFEFNDEYRYVVIGDGSLEDETKEMVNRAGIAEKTIFLGNVDNANGWYSAMDALVMPSLYEGFPVVLIEAMASGLKCVVSSNISDEVKDLGDVKMLPIGRGDYEKWVNALKNTVGQVSRATAVVDVRKRGFEAKESVEKVQKIYLNLDRKGA